MGCSPPGSSVHGILQARILEWFAISSSRGSSQPRGWTRVSQVSGAGRQIIYHWATWEAQSLPSLFRIDSASTHAQPWNLKMRTGLKVRRSVVSLLPQSWESFNNAKPGFFLVARLLLKVDWGSLPWDILRPSLNSRPGVRRCSVVSCDSQHKGFKRTAQHPAPHPPRLFLSRSAQPQLRLGVGGPTQHSVALKPKRQTSVF